MNEWKMPELLKLEVNFVSGSPKQQAWALGIIEDDREHIIITLENTKKRLKKGSGTRPVEYYQTAIDMYTQHLNNHARLLKLNPPTANEIIDRYEDSEYKLPPMQYITHALKEVLKKYK